jgi:uncharacterized protein YbjT (DUF2867 family)
MTATVAVIGATARLGRRVAERLAAHPDLRVIAAGRTAAKLTDLPCETRVADAGDPASLRAALADARIVVSAIHARFAPAILAALPGGVEKVVLTGSTRRFTRFPDRAAQEVADAEAAFLASGRAGVMLHPTMIYGAEGENNVRRIARLIRRFGLIPLPGGGRGLIQPIHLDDVAWCIERAVERDWPGPEVIAAAGPEPVAYADFVRAIARSIGHPVRIVAVPAWAMRSLAALTRYLPGVPTVTQAEAQRLMENKDFSVAVMTSRLGVAPRPLADGLREALAGF